MGISHTSVQRIWKEYGLKPHLVRTFTNQSIIKDTFSISFDVASCYDMA
jgi:hypothetical protein